jgi:hypothetical protein
VALPNTMASVGMPAAENRVRSRKARPPGMKISAWVGRSAPPDSTRLTIGRRLTQAISPARWVFLSEYGFTEPPRTVGSFAMITHGVPETKPMQVTTLAPTAKSEPYAATGISSSSGASGSTSSSIRSRGNSLPRAWWRVVYFSPPPARA